ncbi:HTTM domain-containing protein [Pontimicrobium aquaticum]|uniref:HTTM domain-containing protein n=1 Tax=Pontimicrobium aquaticum TaxID=2565367 RepID=A0A4U0F075_9FLAO|nr:HTTM domain-containing protein [Pontimicrobium aquaticum]TJY37746.1 HTTM domain-containing protein [Pontimicrobium aquaticum]
MFNKLLFKPIDNSALIVFRILFGLLIAIESFGAILTGWVYNALIAPKYTFPFIDFEWLQPLPDNWMYVYYSVMGICGLMVMIGYKYRISIVTFLVLWSGTYLMQKTSYNNHYYLLILLSLFMTIVPANTNASIDSKINKLIKSNVMPNWCTLIFIAQMFIVYTYASIAKWYPDWLDTTVIEILLKSKADYAIIGNLLQEKWIHYIIAYFGIIFDLLIVPLLLWKRSRKLAFIVAIFFHLFNSLVFQIGIFPYMSIALCVFFFDPKLIRRVFLKTLKPIEQKDKLLIKKPNLIKWILASYFIIQLVLPLRHWMIKDDVLWTEEGHRLSWRMMLRARQGIISFKVIDKSTNKTIPIRLEDYLSPKQQRNFATKPDMIWQFSQLIKRRFKIVNRDVKVFVDCKVKVNAQPFKPFINPEVDLASVKWNAFKHSSWILPSKQD